MEGMEGRKREDGRGGEDGGEEDGRGGEGRKMEGTG
jgi:hypothetical protein